MRVQIDNLGIPPLAGICTYEEACRTGVSVDDNVELLKRLNYAKVSLHRMFAAHLAHTPEWEIKQAFGHHLWLDAEHSASLRKRVSEMRKPPLHLDKVPDPYLEAFFDEAIRAENTAELLAGIYLVVKPQLARAMRRHLEVTNPLMDQPTCRLFRFMLIDEEEMIAWGERALNALTVSAELRERAEAWVAHLNSYLRAAGGLAGDLQQLSPAEVLPAPRSDGGAYRMSNMPRRDARFRDVYNRSAKVDEYYQDEILPADERTFALLFKRLREMDVPEWMGPILYKTRGKPWEYYTDLSRQLWDETRHSMMGEVGLYHNKVPFYRYPIDLKASSSLNTDFTPFESHLILWGIEQGLMNKDKGKRWEWIIAQQSGMPYAVSAQDYDWADEVLHAQIGRKWLSPEFESAEQMQEEYEKVWVRAFESKKKYIAMSEQQEWWPRFVKEMRE
ncbi:hypothetical protein [Cohnella silvisoli]|uniref:DUF2515 domain-containing protein n=1 Tax=Cohnella silvisoli TaxID=2873699 RepID=A0ABV1KST3_9BACL|nr:hypothetical protein [Cohnella silvisoli]MCD9021356.1 hypothetical protein [Cohnella silvisoli]